MNGILLIIDSVFLIIYEPKKLAVMKPMKTKTRIRVIRPSPGTSLGR